jgi:hypothetical protein
VEKIAWLSALFPGNGGKLAVGWLLSMVPTGQNMWGGNKSTEVMRSEK